MHILQSLQRPEPGQPGPGYFRGRKGVPEGSGRPVLGSTNTNENVDVIAPVSTVRPALTRLCAITQCLCSQRGCLKIHKKIACSVFFEINEYKASIPAALDGSRTAVAQKDKLRSAVIKMYKQLAHYVEAACNEDMATFMLSGFQPKPDKK